MYRSRQILAGAALILVISVSLTAQDGTSRSDAVPSTQASLPDAPSALTAMHLPETREDQPLFPTDPTPLAPRWQVNFDREEDSSRHDAPGDGPPRWKGLPRQVLRDQKFLWLRPFRLKKTDAPWVVALGGTTAALIATDARLARELSQGPPGGGFAFNRRVSQLGGGAGDLSVAGAFYLIGHWRGNERARTTGLLGFRAFADSFIIVQTLKTVTQRPRPTKEGGTVRIDNAEGDFFEGGRSFPSGHSAEAWAVATVVACQYRHKRWMAVAAYSLAGLVSVSRLFERKHFPSDVFVGTALGFMVGRHVCHSQDFPD